MIDWDVIRERGYEGRLTVEETDALVRVASRRLSERRMRHWLTCPYCKRYGGTIIHTPDCPIRVLAAVSPDGRLVTRLVKKEAREEER